MEKKEKVKAKFYCPACGKKNGIEPKMRRSLEKCCECAFGNLPRPK